MVIQFILQFLLPAIFLGDLLRKRFSTVAEWLLAVIPAGLVLLFVFAAARWDFFSYYLRYLPPLLLVLAAAIAFRRIPDLKSAEPIRRSWKRAVFHAVLILILSWLNVQTYRGYFYGEAAIDLSYPLRNGTYYVGGGGTSRWINNHTVFAPQTYALDILKLNAAGNPGAVWDAANLPSYESFGDTVFSPCRGTVLAAVDSLPDQLPPGHDRRQPAGNHVVILSGEEEIVLAHLMKGSVAVAAGDRVDENTILGKIGNSGNSSQPHLHIHAERGGTPGQILNGRGVPITFEGRFLVRNSLFRRKGRG